MVSNSFFTYKNEDIKRAIKYFFFEHCPNLEKAPAHKLRRWLDGVSIQLNRERNRGKMRHYRYDLNKHIALAAARKALRARLKQLGSE